MEYVKDWEKSRKRFEAYWERELTDRCCIAIQAPRDPDKGYDRAPLPENYADREPYWTDGENILGRYLRLFESTYFAGDAFPAITLNFGPSGHTGFYKGVKFRYDECIWFYPIEDIDWENPDLATDPDSFLFSSMINVAKYLNANNNGRYMVGNAHIAGDGDALALMRGSQDLMEDLFMDEPYIHGAMKHIQQTWFNAYDAVYDIVKDGNDGMSCIAGWWAAGQGRVSTTQVDIAVMISPDKFDEYFLPYLRKQLAYVDKGFYHLDGCEQVRHLDSLLSINELKAIQWQVVESQPSPVEFIPVLQRIQAANKGIILHVEENELEPIMKGLSSKGLLLLMDAKSPEHADDIVKRVERLTRD